MLVEADRIGDVPTVRDLESIRIPLVDDGPEERIRVALHSPCVVEVVFGAGAVKARGFLAVDEEHVVAFAPPASLEMLHGEVASHVMPLALDIEYRVVVLALEVGDVVDLGRIHLQVRPPAVAWVLAMPSRVEVGGVFRKRLVVHFVIDVEVQNKWQLVLVDDLDLRLLVEGHGEVAGHGARSAVFSGFFGLE